MEPPVMEPLGWKHHWCEAWQTTGTAAAGLGGCGIPMNGQLQGVCTIAFGGRVAALEVDDT